jgi:hypothetical protein
LENLGRAAATLPARLIFLASRIALTRLVCNCDRARNVLSAGQEVVAMERLLTAFWDEDRQELEVRRPTGQVFRFSGRQAVAGGHEVFGVQTDGDLIVVLTGASGSRRPTWKVRFTQTGTYRGTSAL